MKIDQNIYIVHLPEKKTTKSRNFVCTNCTKKKVTK